MDSKPLLDNSEKKLIHTNQMTSLDHVNCVYEFADLLHDEVAELFLSSGAIQDFFNTDTNNKLTRVYCTNFFNSLELQFVFTDILKYEKEEHGVCKYVTDFQYHKTQRGFYALFLYNQRKYFVGKKDNKWELHHSFYHTEEKIALNCWKRFFN